MKKNKEKNPLLAQRGRMPCKHGRDFASQNKEENPLLAQGGSDFASQNKED